MLLATSSTGKVLTKRGRGRKRRNNRNKKRNAADGLGEAEIDCDSSHYVYLIIGSKDSTDLDTLYVFDRLPPIQACYKFCDFAADAREAEEDEEQVDSDESEGGAKEVKKSGIGEGSQVHSDDASLNHLQRQRRLKPENKNIVVLDGDGIVCASFKGIPDAIHNCVHYTYALHEQDHPSPLAHRLVHRNVPMRLVKATRDLMGIVSKTKYRQHSKSALKATNSFAARRECLMQVDFREVKDELNASQFKTVAFHFSQLIGLMRGREYFTKADLATAFPDLAPFLHRADDATVHLEVLNKYRDIFVTMIAEGLQVHAKGPLLLFAADPTSCKGRWNMLTYESRGVIIDSVRERCVAYPLDHFFALDAESGVVPSWPTDEELLRREGIEQLLRGSTTAITTDDRHNAELSAFYTAFLDPNTHRPSIAGERAFDVPPSVKEQWDRLVGNDDDDMEGKDEQVSRLLEAMKLYTFILVATRSGTEEETGTRLALLGLRHHHTWDMQPLAVVQDVAAQVGLPSVAL